MVSEGVDVPRLAVGVYATSASTPLFFAQAIGRFVRSRRPGETASIFLPSVPNLLLLASEMEAQRNHVLGKPHRETLDDPLEAELAKQNRDEPDDLENKIEYLGADAELDQVIFDGASFGTATPAGSDEEADYPESRAAGRGVDARPAAPPAGGAAHQAHRLRRDAADLDARPAARLRSQLNALVSVAHHRTGRSHGWIHNELRRICGGPPVAAATRDQLSARIEAVRGLTSRRRPDRGAPQNSSLQTQQTRQVGDGVQHVVGLHREFVGGPAVQGVLAELSGAHQHPVMPTTWAASTSLLRSSPTMYTSSGSTPSRAAAVRNPAGAGLPTAVALRPEVSSMPIRYMPVSMRSPSVVVQAVLRCIATTGTPGPSTRRPGSA